MKKLFETSVEKKRFSLNQTYNNVFKRDGQFFTTKTKQLKETLEKLIGSNIAKKVLKSLLRFTFYIELVKKPAIETTKYAVRWTKELEDDVRFASYKVCKEIFETLFEQLLNDLKTQENQTFLKKVVTTTHVSYELPIDYKTSTLAFIHHKNNIAWCWDKLPKRMVRLRMFLKDSTQCNYATFFKGIYKKIKIKTYLTDRAVTGDYKTNREKRWECHPNSVHFALRKNTWAIEVKLIEQVCHLSGFPLELRKKLVDNQLIIFKNKLTKCPITLEPFSFKAFQFEIENVVHGKSNFQVGHMNPLKSSDNDMENGHKAHNISWISEEGNRIQGSNSVNFTRKLIIKIYENYKAANIINNTMP